MQTRLLELPDPSLDDAVKAAQAMETAAKDASEIARAAGSPSTEAAVNKMAARSGACSRCGAAHSPSQCQFVQAQCFTCGRTGHLARFELQQRFRFGYDGIMYLVELLRPDLEPQTRRSQVISTELQAIVALQFFATGNFPITAGDYVHVHVSTASRIVRKVTAALARRAERFIRWSNEAEAAEVQQQFFEVAGFPSVGSAVDGTHIRIQGPSDHEEAYVNRHGYHSINVQLVVDAAYQIRHVVARWPGSANDSKIFKKSALSVKLPNGTYDGLLLGESGYACDPWLMTPFLVSSSSPEEEYNKAHITTRCIVERTIGQLKKRFNCLHAELRMLPQEMLRHRGGLLHPPQPRQLVSVQPSQHFPAK
ncbi:putative nuclease HARBI1 [Ixodes scapularis]